MHAWHDNCIAILFLAISTILIMHVQKYTTDCANAEYRSSPRCNCSQRRWRRRWRRRKQLRLNVSKVSHRCILAYFMEFRYFNAVAVIRFILRIELTNPSIEFAFHGIFAARSVVHCFIHYRFTYIIMQWDNAKIGSETAIDYSIKAHARANPQAHVIKEVHLVGR